MYCRCYDAAFHLEGSQRQIPRCLVLHILSRLAQGARAGEYESADVSKLGEEQRDQTFPLGHLVSPGSWDGDSVSVTQGLITTACMGAPGRALRPPCCLRTFFCLQK